VIISPAGKEIKGDGSPFLRFEMSPKGGGGNGGKCLKRGAGKYSGFVKYVDI
jgi:hypothetical protein